MQQEVVDLVMVRTDQTRELVSATRSLLRTDAFKGEFDPAIYDVKTTGEVVFES